MGMLCAESLNAQADELIMRVGETRRLEMTTGRNLRVSQKNIVNLRYDPAGYWQATAMKPGTVVIQDEEGSDQPTVVMVKSRGRGRLMEDDDRDWRRLCEEPGLHCDVSLRTIGGTMQSVQKLIFLRRRCERLDCEVFVRLSKKALESWENLLSEQVKPYFTVTARPEGQGILWSTCRDKPPPNLIDLADGLTMGLVKEGVLKVLCAGEGEALVIKAKAFFLHKEDADELGLKWDQPVAFTQAKNRLMAPKLSAFLARHQERMVGEPVLRVKAGEEAMVHTGTELFYLKKEGESAWKRIGFSLKVAALPTHSHQDVLLRYEMNLSQPQNDERLQATSMASEVRLTFNQPVIVGELAMSASSTKQESLYPLHSLPIIGPLLRLAGQSRGESRLFLTLAVVKDSETKELPDFPAW